MQHGFFLWWVTVWVLAIVGVVIGRFCTRVADNYDRLMHADCPPDSTSLGRAVYAALTPGPRPIIWAEKAGGVMARGVTSGLVLAAMLTILYVLHGPSAWFVLLALVNAALLLLACIDARTCLLPDAITLPLLWLGLISAWAGFEISLHDSVLGVVVGYGVPAALRLIWLCLRGVDGLGQGDIKLLAALGAWLGPSGALCALLVACVGGILFAVVQQRRLRPSGAYPFGPFLAGAGMAVFVFPSTVQSLFWI